MKHKRRKSIFVLLCLLALLVGVPAWLTCRYVQQEQCNLALIAAIKHHDAAAVITLLDQGADPNMRDRTGHEKLTFWKLLRAKWKGASLSHPDDPTALAVVFDFPQVIDRKKMKIIPERPADVAIVKALLAKGARVNVMTARGWPLIMRPTSVGYEKSVECLLAKGADANAAIPEGFTVLMLACENSDAHIVQMLLDRGARVEARYKGWTALGYASMSSNPSIRQILKRAGAKE
jgi:ankyrin repeat protein